MVNQGVSLIFIVTNPLQCYLSLIVSCVYFVYIHHYTICISIICFIGKAGEGGDEFSKFLKKKGGEEGFIQIFSIKREGLVKW